jgi:putative transposase
MRPPHCTLNRHQVHRSATDLLRQHVPLSDYKRKVTAPTLWAVLLVVAAEATSIHAACTRLDGLACCEETIRKALYAGLPGFAELQRRLNRALAGRLPKALRRRPQRLAIDLTLIPTTARRSATRRRSTAARPATAPATSTPTPPRTSPGGGSGSPWR